MKQIDGQITLDGFKKIKPLIWSQSLTSQHSICPYCKMENPDSEKNRKECKNIKGKDGKLVFPYCDLPLDFCPACGNQYDRVNHEIRMSKDYAECVKLGLHGAVYKDEKGSWREREIK